ncbi:MAG: tRNA N6-adenosine threonylcarbamoyltransferase [Firmicutes bacterium ADurb.Bin182]|nr:MAG: tRNA N6-adenosine threonylcarbamoyltransferase [Firmicutes bacterium ADurb.Bin182]
MDYASYAKEKAASIIKSGNATVLAIETSCDETAAAVVKNGRTVISNIIHSQIPIHQKYGGVVPELASRSHTERIRPVTDEALSKAGLTLKNIDAVAVTFGPGLVGALLTGVSYAKGLALAGKLPLVGINHIHGHIAANYLSCAGLEPPFVCLVVSGGHSHIVLVRDYLDLELLGKTRDDAAGEAFDKVARVLGLGYPGGPKLESLALSGDPHAFDFHSPFNSGDHPDFSFSGPKTAVINLLHKAKQKGETVNFADIAASFQLSVVKVLCAKTVRAAKLSKVSLVALAGGVSANKLLRSTMLEMSESEGMKFCCPEFEYCTDNAAMIGSAGFYALMSGRLHGLELNADANPGLK